MTAITSGAGRMPARLAQHNVGLGPQHREQCLIGRAAEAAGQASERGGAVDAGDHVEPHGRPRARTRQLPVQRGWIHGIAEKRPKLAHRHTSAVGGPQRGP